MRLFGEWLREFYDLFFTPCPLCLCGERFCSAVNGYTGRGVFDGFVHSFMGSEVQWQNMQ